jgi:hypothetical protein
MVLIALVFFIQEIIRPGKKIRTTQNWIRTALGMAK